MLIGLGQMLVETGDVCENLRRAVGMIERAGEEHCNVAVLPECLDIGWTNPHARTLAEPIPGPYSQVLAEAARRAGIHVVAGLTERDGDRLCNAAVLLSPTGEVLLKHRKINELAIAHDLYTTGTCLEVAATGFGMVGIPVCADNFPDSLCYAEALIGMGAKLLLSPCAWAVDADHDNRGDPYGVLWTESYASLTRRFAVTVVGVSCVGWMREGPWQGRKCIGNSLVFGQGGKMLARAPYGEAAECFMTVTV